MYEYMIGVGAMKAGTTLMYRQLLEHPQIRRGVRKSVDYFNITQAPSKAQYDALFAPGEGQMCLRDRIWIWGDWP